MITQFFLYGTIAFCLIILGPILSVIFPKLPKKVLLIIFLSVIFIFLTAGGFYLYSKGLRMSFRKQEEKLTFEIYFIIMAESSIKQGVAFNPKLIKDQPEQVEKGSDNFHSYFNNEEDWVGWEGFAKSLSNPKILMSRGAWPFDNPNLWFQKLKTVPIFNFTLKVTPQNNDKGNLVIAYGQVWRCIIAESNFNAITCETDYATRNKKRYLKTLSSLDRLPIKPKTELIIEGSTRIAEGNKLELSLLLKYIDSTDNRQEAPFVFNFDYPSPEPETNREYVGIGLIDSDGEGIAIEFSEFTLSLKQ